MNQGNNRGSGSDDRYSTHGAERDDRSDWAERDDRDDRRQQGGRQRQQEAYSGGDWLTHRQQGGSDWQGRSQSQPGQPGQPGAGSDWQGSGQQPGGSRWSGQGTSSQGATSVSSSSGYGGYEGQSRRYDEGYGEGRYGEYGEGRQGGRQQSGRDTGDRNTPQRHAERERWGDWHQEDAAARGSEWSSQQGSQRDEWGQGRARWDQPARGSASSQRQGGWEQGRGERQQGYQQGRQQGRQMQGRDTGSAWGSGWEGPTGSEPDMRTHYRGGYGVSDYGQQESPTSQSQQTWQRRAAADWMDERERRERHAAGLGPMGDRGGRGYGGSTGAGGYDPNEHAYEHFTGANERSDLNRGYGGAGGSAAARRAQRAGPKGYQRSDERIREDLCERLAMSGRVDVREVEVSVASGVVTLGGTVQDRQQKYRIEDMAEEVFGVKDVHNQIRVTRDTGMGSSAGQGRTGGSRTSQGMTPQGSGSAASQGGTAPSSAAGSTGSLGTGIGSDASASSGFGSGTTSGSTSGSTSGRSGS